MSIITRITRVVGVCLLLVLCHSILYAQEPQSLSGGLFVRTSAPSSTNGTAFPSDAGFFRVDPTVLSQASRFSPPISRIDGFPLGSRSVTLNVTQFDALTHDAKIFATTEHGDVPLHMPEYALLRGEVEGLAGSHVFLAVYPNMVLGYVEMVNADGTLTRYLVSPHSSGEGTATMICYNGNAIDRSNDVSGKWKCGTEELPANFKQLDRIAAEIAEPVDPRQEASVQSRSVRVMKVDIECDQLYYLDFKDTTKALAYALTTLAAASDIYIRDLSAALVSQYLRVWTVTDPYRNDADTTIETTLGSWSTSNDLPSDNRAGGILLSGRRLIGGLAFLGRVCADVNAYCVCGTDDRYTYPHDGFIWDPAVIAHEWGHVIGSPHTHSCFWAPAIDSCYPAEGGCFSGTVPTLGTIMSYCHLTSFGTAMKFHPRQFTKFLKWIQQADCATDQQLPQANAGPDAFVCGSDSAAISGSGSNGNEPYTYSWRNMKTNAIVSSEASFKIRPPATTTYVLTLTDNSNLRTYDTMVVNIDAVKAVTGGSLAVCGVGQLSLQGTSTGGLGSSKKGWTYQWTDKTSNQIVGVDSVVTAPFSATTTYTFKVTDSVGCSSSADLIVTLSPKPNCVIDTKGVTSICENDSTQLDAGTGFKTYLWLKDGAATTVHSQKYWVKTGGSYSCLVTNTGQGCEDTSAAVTISMNPAPSKPTISQVGNDLVCPKSTEYVSYKWYKNGVTVSNGDSSFYTPKGNGPFWVVVTGANGCKSRSNTINVTSGVLTKELDEHVSVYPNPATSEIVIEWNDIVGATRLSLGITDILGKTVYTAKPTSATSSSAQSIDIRALPAGTYMLHYDFGFGEGVRKFVKQ